MRLAVSKVRKAISRTTTIGVLIILVVVAVAGAYYFSTSSPSGSSTTSSSSSSSTATSSSQSSITTTSSSTNSTITPLGITWANVPNTDPAIGSDEAGTSALINLYDTLVYPTSSGALQPDLATSWTVSPNGTTYTFNLRSGVTFHNGDALTASDVVFSMNRLLTMGQGYSYLFTASVANTTAIGTTTVVFDLKKTFGPFLSTLPRLYILDQKQVVAHEVSTGSQYGSNLDYGSAWLLTHDAGSGPYSITYANLETNVILKEFPNYWNGTLPNQPQEVNFIGSTTPSTVASLFKSGQIQITDTYQTYQNVETLAALPNAKLVTIPSLNEFYFMIDTQKQPTNDIYLREAMTYAFNYSAVINNIWPGVQYAAGPVPAALPGHNPNIPASHQDLAMANQLIKQSAYYKSGNLSSYPITFYWVTQVPQEQSLAEQFASDMAKIGITVNVVGEPWLTVVADLGNETSSPNIAAVQDAASYYEAGSLLQSRYTTPAEGTWEQNEWLHNSTLDSLIYSALSTVNQTQRFQDYFNIQQQIYNMYPSIYAFDVTEVRAYYPSVVNWYAANGHPNTLEGYDWFFRDIQFYPAQLAALFG